MLNSYAPSFHSLLSHISLIFSEFHLICQSGCFCVYMGFLKQQSSEPSERLVGLSDDVGAGFISGHSQPASTSELNVDRPVELPAQDEIGNMGVSKVIRVDQKRFFFDLGSNNRGHFLRISEVFFLSLYLALALALLFIFLSFPSIQIF